MSKDRDTETVERIKKLVNKGRIDDAVEVISYYLNQSTEENYIDKLENVIETLLTLHGGRTVLRFLIENLVIDIPSILENLSKKDSMLRYSFLLLLKSMCEDECDLFLPFTEELLESEDPNVKEADLQLLIFMAGGTEKISKEPIIEEIASKLTGEKDFVTEKAIQALIAIGNQSPSKVTKILTEYTKERPEDEELKKNVDNILKAIVSVEKIDEIVETEKELEEENKKESVVPEKAEKEIEKQEEKLHKTEEEITDKELELKKKELELKKKKLELEEKEKELEKREIEEKERALKKREELIEKEKKLAQVELELKEKDLEDKEKKLREEEAERLMKRIKELEDVRKKEENE
jgi:hypothetical protein